MPRHHVIPAKLVLVETGSGNQEIEKWIPDPQSS